MKTKTNNFTMTYGVMQWIVIASIFAAHASSPCTSLCPCTGVWRFSSLKGENCLHLEQWWWHICAIFKVFHDHLVLLFAAEDRVLKNGTDLQSWTWDFWHSVTCAVYIQYLQSAVWVLLLQTTMSRRKASTSATLRSPTADLQSELQYDTSAWD